MLRLFLRAYPKRFRERHGEDLLRLCRDVYGPLPHWRCGFAAIA